MKTPEIIAVFRSSILALVIGLMGTGPSWAQQGMRFQPGHMWDGGWHGWVFGPMMMILFVALVALAVVIVVRSLGSGDRGSPAVPERTPLDILKERFARGEIDKEEFEERRRVLEK